MACVRAFFSLLSTRITITLSLPPPLAVVNANYVFFIFLFYVRHCLAPVPETFHSLLKMQHNGITILSSSVSVFIVVKSLVFIPLASRLTCAICCHRMSDGNCVAMLHAAVIISCCLTIFSSITMDFMQSTLRAKLNMFTVCSLVTYCFHLISISWQLIPYTLPFFLLLVLEQFFCWKFWEHSISCYGEKQMPHSTLSDERPQMHSLIYVWVKVC